MSLDAILEMRSCTVDMQRIVIRTADFRTLISIEYFFVNKPGNSISNNKSRDSYYLEEHKVEILQPWIRTLPRWFELKTI